MNDHNDMTKNQVLELLTNYSENERKIALLHYELEHPAHVSAEEMIDALSFGHAAAQGGSVGHVSNKTLYIALNYQDKAKDANNDVYDDIAFQLHKLERQQERLRHYLSLMDEMYAEIIRMTYFHRMANDKIAAHFRLHPRTVYKYRQKAIDLLCEMYSFAADVHHDLRA